MQFLVLGWDGTDDAATARRDAARPAHLAKVAELRQQGHLLVGAPLLGDGDRILGSVLVVDFDSRDQLDEWLREEPLQLDDVWQRVEVHRCRVSDDYLARMQG